MIELKSAPSVTLVKSNADDNDVAMSAWVSFNNDSEERLQNRKQVKGLINFLYRNQHMTPFEHSVFTFRIECPIFVAREIFRHRSSAFNEMSGRYTKLIPTFYVPDSNRPVVQQGKTGDYSFAMDISLNAVSQTNLRAAYETCWNAYENMLDLGVAKEVARMCLPVGIYTQFYMTLNARNLMHFLDLRCADQALYEIRQVADEMSRLFEKQMPLTFEAWNATN